MKTTEIIYTREEALKEALAYFKNDELAAKAWVDKYALKDSKGNLFEKSPDQMHWRLANEFARIESKYPNGLSAQQIYDYLKNFKFIIPQGSPMAGIGNTKQIMSISNCFVIGDPTKADSYGAIFKADEEQVQIMKRRGGVGQDLSHLRPQGAPTMNSAITSTGIVPFMERYSNSTREVAQDGRRGALMLTVHVEHPDTENFVNAKTVDGKVTGANVSVRINDKFMKAAKAGEQFKQQFPIGVDAPRYETHIDASKLWKKIVNNAWQSGEPGVLFWDTILRESIADCYSKYGFETICTNPCGEIPLCVYDSCRLLVVNLFSFVNDPFTPNAHFDNEKFKEVVTVAQRLMDDVIDLELEKIDQIISKIEVDPEIDTIKRVEKELWEKIREKCVQGRRTGLGITAEGDMLAALGIRYGSTEATEYSKETHKKLALAAFNSSVQLAEERGAFPIYDWTLEQDNPFIQRIAEADPALYKKMQIVGRRNIALLTVAPTGTVSLMAQTSSGIEPAFMIWYKRRRKINRFDTTTKADFIDSVGDHWEEYNVFHHKFIDWLLVQGVSEEEARKMNDADIAEWVEKSPYHKATANDVDWLEKVKLQGAVQKWVDHSISCTVNVPNEATVDLIDQIYTTAWESGCKGITVYRDGSRSGVLLKVDDKKEESRVMKENHAPKRPKTVRAEIVRFTNDSSKWIGFMGMYKEKNGEEWPYELFTGEAKDFDVPTYVEEGNITKNKEENGDSCYDFTYLDKEGKEVTMKGINNAFNEEYWNYARLISTLLRHGMPLPYLVNVVSSLRLNDDIITTWKNGVLRMIKKYIKDGTKIEALKRPANCNNPDEKCNMIYQEGCLICTTCGNSKCG